MFRFRALCAIVLILLTASPFTAPFASCDLGVLQADGVHGSQLKTGPSSEESLTIPVFAGLGGPLLAVLHDQLAFVAQHPARHNAPPTILRL